jgi:uncharacterized protein YbaR (Trm112 family)
VCADSQTAESRRCPICRGPLVFVGIREVSLSDRDFRRRRAYWCPTGCRGAEPDGMFEFIECPACGSDDTTCTRSDDGVQELVCAACGTITGFEMASALL